MRHGQNDLGLALGRKNFLFVHSEDAGKELALLYSLAVSCTRVGINPVEYLADVLDRVDKTADGHFAELLPDRWKPPSQRGSGRIFDV
jgi:transposase